jgi:hypothetical protein
MYKLFKDGIFTQYILEISKSRNHMFLAVANVIEDMLPVPLDVLSIVLSCSNTGTPSEVHEMSVLKYLYPFQIDKA